MNRTPENLYLNYNTHKIHYILFGNGEKLLFCFHGFAETAFNFSVLESGLGKIYTIVSIDLPLHGLTQWNDQFFLKSDLKNIISLFLQQFNKKRFSLMGFSLGGKMVIGALKELPKQIDEVFLIAPDGLRKNIWYKLAIYPAWGRKLFLHLVKHPEKYFATVKFLAWLHIIPSSLKKFIESQLATEEKRQFSFDVWYCIKDFDTDVKTARQLLNENKIHSYLFFGEFDKVIRPIFGKRFVKGLNNTQLIILPKGHHLVKEYLNEEILKALNK
ncbi:MAG: alpha/beta hydrolase [Bacteroidota bacterium]